MNVSERRIYPESFVPMTPTEHQIFLDAYARHEKKLGFTRSRKDVVRLARGAGNRAVRHSRGKRLSAKARTLDLLTARK